MNTKIKRLGVIGAMESEISLLLSKMSDTESTKIGKHTFFCGTLSGMDVVLARAGVGKVNATICTCNMISHFSPDAIINVGVGGSLSGALDLGDVVVATDCVEYDLDYGSLGDERGAIFFGDGESIVKIPTDSSLSDAIFDASVAISDGKYKTERGLIASGDKFVSSESAREDILSFFPDALVCEMEGAAIAHASFVHRVPVAVLRSISDGANSDSEIDFPTFVNIAADRAARIIERLAGNIK